MVIACLLVSYFSPRSKNIFIGYFFYFVIYSIRFSGNAVDVIILDVTAETTLKTGVFYLPICAEMHS